jgi:hypothetical protein
MKIEAKMPRMVFDGPNNGRPSKNRIPVSSGRAKRKPKIFFATIGVPFANVISTNNCRIRRACIPAAYLNTDCRSIHLSETIGASGDTAQRFHLFSRWLDRADLGPVDKFERVAALRKQIEDRPAVKKVLATEA